MSTFNVQVEPSIILHYLQNVTIHSINMSVNPSEIK